MEYLDPVHIVISNPDGSIHSALEFSGASWLEQLADDEDGVALVAYELASAWESGLIVQVRPGAFI